MKLPRTLAIIFSTSITLAGALSAQQTAVAEHPVHWSSIAPYPLPPKGDSARIVLRATIEEFWHLYSTTQKPGGPTRTTVTLLAGEPWAIAGTVRAPTPMTIPDANFNLITEVYDDSVSLGLTLRASGSSALKARIAVRYQACTTRYCLPARTDTVVVSFRRR